MHILFLMADGFEETEFVTPFDYWQRGGLNVTLASISNSLSVTGKLGLRIQADILLKDADLAQFDAVMLPGGGLGVKNSLTPRANGCSPFARHRWCFRRQAS